MGNGCAEEYWKEKALKAENELLSKKVLENVDWCESCKYFSVSESTFQKCMFCTYFKFRYNNWEAKNE